jgi:hypothetical protein
VRQFLPGALGAVQGLLISTTVLLVVFIGFCTLFGLSKLRHPRRGSRVIRSLDEALGTPQQYLPPDAPRGIVDQLNPPPPHANSTQRGSRPELLDPAGRKGT